MLLYAGVRNLQYECRNYRDDRVISKNQNKMAVAYYNIDGTYSGSTYTVNYLSIVTLEINFAF